MQNTNLLQLDKISKLEFKKKALSHKLKYKRNVGLSRNMKFGVEIEALGSNFIETMRKKRNIFYFHGNPAYKPNEIYNSGKWILYTDSSLQLENGDRVSPFFEKLRKDWTNGNITFEEYLELEKIYNGGEVTSPILKDNYISWNGVRKMLDYMKERVSSLRVNHSCSSHIHFDIGIFKNNPELLYSFMVLLAETEPVLTRFFCGEFINLRSFAREYAREFDELFLRSLIMIKDMSSYRNMLSSLYNLEGPGEKAYSFDFWNIYFGCGCCSTTFENRVPNGTLLPTIIQNNVMVTGHLMEYAAKGKYDYEKGIYNIKSGRNYNKLDDEFAFYVADFLPNDKFKLDFLTQYYKDENTSNSETLVKTKRIFY